jgi:energy-converting hydrogenase B subunit H
MFSGVKNIIGLLALAIFSVALFQAIYGFDQVLYPGISQLYLWIGPDIAPNAVTNVIFDWRAYDTLGEALILVTAVVVTLLIFGRGKVRLGGK